jgi:RNA polymerase sigma-70 factor, ECF subfamily
MGCAWTSRAENATLDRGWPKARERIRLATDGGTEAFAMPVVGTGRLPRFSDTDRREERRRIRQAQSGSEEGLEWLYRRHWRWAHRAAYFIVHDAAAAEDIAQEAFMSAIRSLDRFDRSRPFGPWLNRIAVNRAIDWARARALRAETAAHTESVAQASLADDRRAPYADDLVRALASLSPEHRAVVVLRHLLEYTPGEIAELLELPRGTVNSRLRRGLDRLRAAIDEEPDR